MEKLDFTKIIDAIAQARDILIYTHVLMDGDALGSSVALCEALRSAGKNSFVLIEDDIPEYLFFIAGTCCTSDQHIIENPDLSIAVDSTDIERFFLRKEKFFQGAIKICIDHHHTSGYFGDINYVDEHSASTGEIIFKLLKAMDVKINKAMAEAIYVAITTDTGNFQYTNTTASSHIIAAELIDIGIDLEKIGVELYQNVRIEKLTLTAEILETTEIICGGKVAIAFISLKMLDKTNTTIDESEGIVEILRSIRGVEISIFIKEIEPMLSKVSMRAKSYANVAYICQKFGGGGHKKAAGCTLNESVEDTRKIIMQEVENYFNEQRDN
ncbi:MAG: DHH family phosphoesterase [Eubacteriales bacterium]